MQFMDQMVTFLLFEQQALLKYKHNVIRLFLPITYIQGPAGASSFFLYPVAGRPFL